MFIMLVSASDYVYDGKKNFSKLQALLCLTEFEKVYEVRVQGFETFN